MLFVRIRRLAPCAWVLTGIQYEFVLPRTHCQLMTVITMTHLTILSTTIEMEGNWQWALEEIKHRIELHFHAACTTLGNIRKLVTLGKTA